ncbi:alcohol dehydrogenase catalytic domain-containing protein [Streptomyces sp. NPDC006872]|uniref:alcohol dehydrogenase catalytic domain-containing protein n=1 Tax=Streptomyces sp. NPDC006872 TaxID=3155720 RepID=UPI0033DF3304
MRAAVLRGGTVEARTLDDPVPGPGQLLVRSPACGICASDLHFMDHPEAGADDDSGMSTYDQDVDIVMGHEYCAEVVDHGPRTERRIPVGARVSSLPVPSTAAGRRIIGQNPESPGGFGEYLLLTEAITRVVVSDSPARSSASPTRSRWAGRPRHGPRSRPRRWRWSWAAVRGGLDVGPMLGRTVGLDEVPDALDSARDAGEPARIIVVP